MSKGLHFLSRRRCLAPALVLCLLHVWLAASVSRIFSTTSDEIAHLTSGYVYWHYEDYRFQPENGIFPQRWCAIPSLLEAVKFPPRTGSEWEKADVWGIGDKFFYHCGNDLTAMLASGRAMNAILSGLLCLGIFIIARHFFGTAAGFLSLTLACFSPTLLAHGGLITSDTAAGLGFILSSAAWWRLLQRVTIPRLLAAGLATGLLATSKYSVVLMGPVVLALLAIRLLRSKPLSVKLAYNSTQLAGKARMAGLLGTVAAATAIVMLVIWSAYGFRFSPTPAIATGTTGFVQPWEHVLLENPPLPPLMMADGHNVEDTNPNPGVVQHFVTWARDHRLLPEAWLYGLAFVEKNARGRLAFFAGEYRQTGWPEFFPAAFALKTTLPALILIGLGLAAVLRTSAKRRLLWLYRLAPIWLLLAIYWIFSVTSHLNIGQRHLLPTYPLCYVLAGGSLLLVSPRRIWLVCLMVALLGWHIRDSLHIRPDYLAYFNPLAGGPKEAHRLFVDSSLDWGQDLPRLKQWLGQNAGQTPVFLSYFGTGNPSYEGIHATRVGDGYFDWSPRKTPPTLTGGLYCISATMLRRVYTHVRGPWSADYERFYLKNREWLAHTKERAPGQLPTDIDGSDMTPEMINARLMNYEQLVFGRLCHYLENRPPDARIGYSILIYRLSDAEVKFALEAPLAAVNAALVRSAPP